MPVELVDTHCHLYTAPEEEVPRLLENAARAGVKRTICIGAGGGLETARSAIALAERYENVFATVGIHPHDARDGVTIRSLADLIAHPKVVAIGETGLDFFRDWAPVDEQRRLFIETIHLARELKKPLVIHCRTAEDEVLATLIKEGARSTGGVFHCYAGDSELAKRLRDLNFYVSFTGNITFKKAAALRETAREVPLEQILLETDMPYMAPEPFRGGPSEPMHVYQVALTIAGEKGLPLEEVARITTESATSLFCLPVLSVP